MEICGKKEMREVFWETNWICLKSVIIYLKAYRSCRLTEQKHTSWGLEGINGALTTSKLPFFCSFFVMKIIGKKIKYNACSWIWSFVLIKAAWCYATNWQLHHDVSRKLLNTRLFDKSRMLLMTKMNVEFYHDTISRILQRNKLKS